MSRLLEDSAVVAVIEEGPYHRIRLHTPALARSMRPGQFFSADLGGVLRTPLLPAAIGEEELDLLLSPDHPAAALPPGQAVSLLGPLGTPLPHPTSPTRLLLIADADRFPALLPLIHHALDEDCPTALFLRAPAAEALSPLSLLPPALEVRVLTAGANTGGTDTGSAPTEHPLSVGADLASALKWADRVVAAADPALYPALAEAVRAARVEPVPGFAHVLLLPTLVCGVGACRGCGVATRWGYRLACTAGPFFDLLELEAT